MNVKEQLALVRRPQTIAITFGLLVMTGGCSMQEQISTSTSSSGPSMPPSSASGEPRGQESSMPSTLDPNNADAETSDVLGENGGDFGDKDSNMPSGESGTSDGNLLPSGNADTQLDRALEEFDGLFEGGTSNSNVDILDPMGANPATSSSNEPLFEELGGNAGFEEVADSAPVSAASTSETGDAKVGEATGSVGASQPIPDDIGDGRGDNVIERQIRQAALQEADPVLRKELWDEYRRMKGQKD